MSWLGLLVALFVSSFSAYQGAISIQGNSPLGFHKSSEAPVVFDSPQPADTPSGGTIVDPWG